MSAVTEQIKRLSRRWQQRLLMALATLVLVPLLAIGCERWKSAPRPDSVPAEARQDRNTRLWSITDSEGIYRAWYDSGELYESGPMVEGRKEGFWQTFGKDGTLLAEGDFLVGWREGEWSFNDESGRLYLTLRYASEPKRIYLFLTTTDYGNENGSYERYYPDGSLEEQGYFYSGYYHGSIRRYYTDGTQQLSGRFHMDEMDGEWYHYYPDGTLERIVPWREGKLDGVLRGYHPDGSLYQLSHYRNGQLEGEVEIFAPGEVSGGASSITLAR